MNRLAAPVSVGIRQAEHSDAQRLFDWVNHPQSLAGKLESNGSVPWDTHVSWFERRLANPECWIFIIEVGGCPCGQIRFEDKGDGHEVDIFVLPAQRGGDVASGALSQAIEVASGGGGPSRLIARVLSSNVRSARFFRKNGFVEQPVQAGQRLFILETNIEGQP